MLIELFELDNPNLRYIQINPRRLPRTTQSIGKSKKNEKQVDINADWEKAFQKYTEQHKDKSDFDLRELRRNNTRRAFYSRRDLLPDYEFWGRKDLWTIAETIPLILNLNPHVYNWKSIGEYRYDSDLDRKYKETRDLILTAVRAHKFGNWQVNFMELKSIHPTVALNWAIGKKIRIDTNLIDKVREYNVLPEVENKDEIIEQLRTVNEELRSKIELLEETKYGADLPTTITNTIDVFYECWDKIPEDMNHPSEKNIAAYYRTIHDKDASKVLTNSIFKISSPDNISAGGHPKQDKKEWRRKADR